MLLAILANTLLLLRAMQGPSREDIWFLMQILSVVNTVFILLENFLYSVDNEQFVRHFLML